MKEDKKLKIFILLFILGVVFLSTNNLFLRPDSAGYVSYLRSMLFDGDLFLGEEFSNYHVQGVWNYTTDTGMVTNGWSVGNSILWLPFYLLAHLLTLFVNAVGISNLAINGYRDFYLTFIYFSTAFYGMIGLFFMYDTAKRFFNERTAFWAVILIWFGSTYWFYQFFQGSYSHTTSAFLIAWFINFWFRTKDKRNTFQWVYLAFIGGFACLVRWQNCIYFLLPLSELIYSLFKTRKLYPQLKTGFIFLGVVFLAFLPQMITWDIIFGKVLTIPTSFSFTAKKGLSVFEFSKSFSNMYHSLLSSHHGLFVWTPITAVALVGFLFIPFKNRGTPLLFLLLFVLQLFINSLIDWWGGWAFSIRKMNSTIAILTVFLAGYLYTFFNQHFKIKLIEGFFVFLRIISVILLSGCVIWAFTIGVQVLQGKIMGELYVSYNDLITNQLAYPKVMFSSLEKLFFHMKIIPIDGLSFLSLVLFITLSIPLLKIVYRWINRSNEDDKSFGLQFVIMIIFFNIVIVFSVFSGKLLLSITISMIFAFILLILRYGKLIQTKHRFKGLFLYILSLTILSGSIFYIFYYSGLEERELLSRAFSSERQNAKEKALYYYEKCLNSNPKNEDALTNYTRIHCNGLTGKYFRNESWEGFPYRTRIDSFFNMINMVSPEAHENKWSGIWEGYLAIEEAGTYQIAGYFDDAGFIIVNNEQIVALPGVHSALYKNSRPIQLEEKLHHIKIKLNNAGGGSQFTLYWTKPDGTHEMIPFDLFFPSEDAYHNYEKNKEKVREKDFSIFREKFSYIFEEDFPMDEDYSFRIEEQETWWDNMRQDSHQIMIVTKKTGDQITFKFDSEQEGKYNIFINATHCHNCGKYSIRINNKTLQASQTLDSYSQTILMKHDVFMGVADIVEGENTISITVTGKNKKSNGFIIAIDSINFIPYIDIIN